MVGKTDSFKENKRMNTSIVHVGDIRCHTPQSRFSEKALEVGAELIIKRQCLINPLILRRTGVDSFVVVDGIFHYYCAKRASEMDPINGCTINAFIADSFDDEIFLRDQAFFFRSKTDHVLTFDRKDGYLFDVLKHSDDRKYVSDALNGFTKSRLSDVADELNVTVGKGSAKDDLIFEIVNQTVGRRLKSDAFKS